jgi:hypothetical protein
MTLERLICACYNVYPSRTKINIVDCKTTSRLFFGVWNDASTKKYGGLNVIDFEITALNPGGCAKQLNAYVKREEDAPCAPQ